jgi:chromosome partitioning protein
MIQSEISREHDLSKLSPKYAGGPKVIVLANQKGGVGKTTTAINLGTALAAIGQRVLVIDIDPQGNASTGLGIDRKLRKRSTYDVFMGHLTLSETVLQTAIPRLSISPSNIDLLGVELEISHQKDRAYKLRAAINRLNVSSAAINTFEYVLIDCPPSLNLLTINALTAADSLIVPLQCEFFALEGLSQLISTVEDVRRTLNPSLQIQGIVLTMFDPRNTLAHQVVEDVRSFMGGKVYTTMIPRNIRISEAPSHGKPVLLYDIRCSGSQAYLKLASELIQQEALYQNA